MAVTLTSEMITAAQDAQKKYGIPASITLGQIMLESGGKNAGGLSGLAYNYKNLFGQKATKNEAGVTLQTTEQTATGSSYITGAKFRVYDSFAESIDEHGKKWGASKVGNHDTVEGWARALKDHGYATDTEYVDKLMNVIRKNDLTQYDADDVTVEVTAEEDAEREKPFWEKAGAAILSPVLKFVLLVGCVILAAVFFTKATGATLPNVDTVKKAAAKGVKSEHD